MEMDWVPIDHTEVRAGDRIAPLASWTLDVIEVRDNGWWCLNLDTGQPTFIAQPERISNSLHKLVQED